MQNSRHAYSVWSDDFLFKCGSFFLLWLEILNDSWRVCWVWSWDVLMVCQVRLDEAVFLNCAVGSDNWGWYLPSKYFNPQLITWWVQWVEVSGRGWWWEGPCCCSGLVHSSCQRHALFCQGDCGKSWPPEWAAECVDSGPLGCVCVAPTPMQEPTNPAKVLWTNGCN